MLVGRLKPVASTSFWKWFVFATLTVTGADVVRLPAASRARAVSVCAPFETVRVSQASPYGASKSSAPLATPSTKNCTPTTPTLSLASAMTLTMSPTWALRAGDVIETDGGVGSGCWTPIGVVMSDWIWPCVRATL